MSFVYSESGTADESRWIRAVAERCGLRAYTLDADGARPFEELPTGFSGEPEHAVVNMALYRAYDKMLSENDVDVVLTGMGGDAVLLGDGPEPFFFADLLLRGRFSELRRTVHRWVEESPERRPARYWIERCVLTAALRRIRRRLIQDRPPRIPWLAADYALGVARNGKERRSWVPHEAGVADSWFLERVLRSANVISCWGFRSSMRAEFRHPLMYVPLIEFMYSIPWEVKLSPGADRTLQRAAFADVLPDVIVRRNTKAGPDQAIYAGLEANADWVHLLTDRTRLAARGYIDESRWREAVAMATAGRCESIKHFKAAASLEVWLRQLEAPLTKQCARRATRGREWSRAVAREGQRDA